MPGSGDNADRAAAAAVGTSVLSSSAAVTASAVYTRTSASGIAMRLDIQGVFACKRFQATKACAEQQRYPLSCIHARRVADVARHRHLCHRSGVPSDTTGV